MLQNALHFPVYVRKIIYFSNFIRTYKCWTNVFSSRYRFSVIAQPMVYDSNGMHQSHIVSMSGCPIAPHLNPLPNVHIPLNDNFTFVATFQSDPVPKPSLHWYSQCCYYSNKRSFYSPPRRVYEQGCLCVCPDVRVWLAKNPKLHFCMAKPYLYFWAIHFCCQRLSVRFFYSPLDVIFCKTEKS